MVLSSWWVWWWYETQKKVNSDTHKKYVWFTQVTVHKLRSLHAVNLVNVQSVNISLTQVRLKGLMMMMTMTRGGWMMRWTLHEQSLHFHKTSSSHLSHCCYYYSQTRTINVRLLYSSFYTCTRSSPDTQKTELLFLLPYLLLTFTWVLLVMLVPL